MKNSAVKEKRFLVSDSLTNSKISSVIPETASLDSSLDVIKSEIQIGDNFQQSLRPESLLSFIGQERIRKNLSISIDAAKKRNQALDHILLYGPPGLGKTSLSQVIARELGVNIKSTSGPVLEKAGDLAAVLSGLEDRDVLFIDEIHRLPRVVEEVLYSAMEDYRVDILIGQGQAARSIKLELSPFTLVGATTRVGLLTAPLRDRFGIIERLDLYEVNELEKIIERSANLIGIKISAEALRKLAYSSRGTPRIANRLLKRVRDYTEHSNQSVISATLTDDALKLLEVDAKGFTKMDHLLLKTIIEKFSGGPVGVDTLASALNEDKNTIEDVYEPFLIQQGFLKRTPRGREATDAAYYHITGIKRSLF